MKQMKDSETISMIAIGKGIAGPRSMKEAHAMWEQGRKLQVTGPGRRIAFRPVTDEMRYFKDHIVFEAELGDTFPRNCIEIHSRWKEGYHFFVWLPGNKKYFHRGFLFHDGRIVI